MKEYRIIKVEYSNQTTCYQIQRRHRCFLFGPEVWQYLFKIFDGSTYVTTWTMKQERGDKYMTEKDAMNTLESIVGSYWGEVKSIDVVKTVTTV